LARETRFGLPLFISLYHFGQTKKTQRVGQNLCSATALPRRAVKRFERLEPFERF
jgi:hypothetical protein